MRREKNRELIATSIAIILAFIPFGYSMSAMFRWTLWGLSYLCAIFILSNLIPRIERANVLKKAAFHMVLFGLGFVVLWPTIHQQWREEKAGAVEGQLVPMRRSTNPLPGVRVGFGRNSSEFFFFSRPNIPAFRILRDAGLNVGVKNGVPVISAPVRDRFGNMVAIIDNNHWTVFPRHCLDKNYTRDTLEVLDSSGHVLIQVRILGNSIQLQGVWRDEFGNGVELLGNPSGGSYIIIWRNSKEEQNFERPIPLLFKYPSKKYWGRYGEEAGGAPSTGFLPWLW